MELLAAMLRKRLVDRALLRLVETGRLRDCAVTIGCEGALCGAAWALNAQDWVFPGRREGGIALIRGMAVDDYVAQALSTVLDRGGARLAPGLPTAPEQQIVTPGAPGAGRLAQAVGAALGMRERGTNAVAVAFLDAEELAHGAFHAALHLAARRSVPVVAWVMTQTRETRGGAGRYAGGEDPTFDPVTRAVAVGARGVRVDGHDVLASYVMTRDAVHHARAGLGPTLIEARVERVDRLPDGKLPPAWKADDPIARLVALAIDRGALDREAFAQIKAELAAEVGDVLEIMQVQDPPSAATVDEDVYATRPWWVYGAPAGAPGGEV